MVGVRRHASPAKDEPAHKMSKISSRKANVLLELPAIPTEFGNLLSCGQNEVGQLGFGENVSEKKRPAILESATDIVAICAGGMHSIYLTKDGDVYSFGCNDEGALGRNTTLVENSEYSPVKILLPRKCIKISAGDSHSACILDNGTVLAWGSFRDSHGNMGLTLEGNKQFPVEVVPNVKFVDIVSGADHLVLLTNNGKVYTIGCAEQGQLGRVTLRSSGGESRRGKTALLTPGLVFFKGNKFIDGIWASTYCTYVRDRNSKNIFAFGLNNYNQLGLPKNTEPLFTPKVTSFSDVKYITGGQHHALLLKNDNKVYAIGRKDYGRLGVGQLETDLETLTPVKGLGDKVIKHIACGESCSFAVTDDGKIYAWGMGSNNQLGTGSEDDEWEPVLLTGLQVKDKHCISASSGGQHSLFVVRAESTTTKSNGVSSTTTTTNAAAATTKAKGAKK